MSRQRLRIRYAREERAKQLSHTDIMRAWERAIRGALEDGESAATLRRVAIAAPLPVGMTSDAEVLDATLTDTVRLQPLTSRLPGLLPTGLRFISVEEVGSGLSSLQSEVRWADYVVVLDAMLAVERAEAAVAGFLQCASLEWEEARESKTRHYDLRAMIDAMSVHADAAGIELRMRLQASVAGMGRPEQVLLALGLPLAQSIHRSRLVFAAPKSPVRQAWRTRGRFQE